MTSHVFHSRDKRRCNSRSRSTLFIVALTALIAAIDPSANINADDPQSPDQFLLRYPHGDECPVRPFRKLGTDGLKYFGDRICSGGGDASDNLTAHIRSFVSDSEERIRFRVTYPIAKEGDLIPIFGRVCQVGEVVSDQAGPGVEVLSETPNIDTTTLTMASVDIENLGCKPLKNGLAIPVGGNAIRYNLEKWTGMVHLYYIVPKSIETVDSVNTCQMLVSSADFVWTNSGFEARNHKSLKSTMRVGDRFETPRHFRTLRDGRTELLVDKEAFTIRDIVPPTPERKIKGWVTLQPLLPGWPADDKEVQRFDGKDGKREFDFGKSEKGQNSLIQVGCPQ